MLYRIKGRATKCAPAAISAIAGIHTHEAAAIIRKLFDRKTVNGAYMDELTAALVELGWKPDYAVRHRSYRQRRHARRQETYDSIFADVPFDIRSVTIGRVLDVWPSGTWAIPTRTSPFPTASSSTAWKPSFGALISKLGMTAPNGATGVPSPDHVKRQDPRYTRIGAVQVQTGEKTVHALQSGPTATQMIYSSVISFLEVSMSQTAKLFWSGRSQAVRLPKEFRMEGAEVRIRRQGAAVILEPVASDWAWLDGIVGEFSDDFFATGRSQPGLSSRTELDSVFD